MSTGYAQHHGHGGFADGVLGLTTDAGQITLVNGWNFYFASDATQIEQRQYDIETVVRHELGHALGSSQSTDRNSVTTGRCQRSG